MSVRSYIPPQTSTPTSSTAYSSSYPCTGRRGRLGIGYVVGIGGAGLYPNLSRIGGTVMSMNGPKPPRTHEKKMTGLSWAWR